MPTHHGVIWGCREPWALSQRAGRRALAVGLGGERPAGSWLWLIKDWMALARRVRIWSSGRRVRVDKQRRQRLTTRQRLLHPRPSLRNSADCPVCRKHSRWSPPTRYPARTRTARTPRRQRADDPRVSLQLPRAEEPHNTDECADTAFRQQRLKAWQYVSSGRNETEQQY